MLKLSTPRKSSRDKVKMNDQKSFSKVLECFTEKQEFRSFTIYHNKTITIRFHKYKWENEEVDEADQRDEDNQYDPPDSRDCDQPDAGQDLGVDSGQRKSVIVRVNHYKLIQKVDGEI